jgi:hypothetical protein
VPVVTSPDAVRSAPPEPKRSERVRVVYIVGARNCGSTLLDAILGNAPGACGLGEAAGFYRYRAGTTCACGASPAGCRLCHAVEEGVTRVMPFSDFDRVSRMPLKERRAHWMLKRTGRRAAYVDAAPAARS